MGLFCVSFHVRTSDVGTLHESLRKQGGRYRTLGPKRGWVSAYDEDASHQDDSRIRAVAERLSRDLNAPAVAFLVHDSDIACYWLHDAGRAVDEFNSCPDYFDDDAGQAGPSGGNPDLLLPYCRKGVSRSYLEEVLSSSATFAEEVVEKLARALGIDPERALADYRDEEPDQPESQGGDDEDGGGGGFERRTREVPGRLLEQLGSLFGRSNTAPADPRVAALVAAAARGDVTEVERALNSGPDVNGTAPGPLPVQPAMARAGYAVAGPAPQMAMTPLIAAVAHKHGPAVERLLAAGADPNSLHPMCGTAVHLATATGEPDLLRVLLNGGGNPAVRNVLDQTPLDALRVSRGAVEQLLRVQEAMKSMNIKLPAMTEQFTTARMPVDGWNQCEAILKEARAE